MTNQQSSEVQTVPVSDMQSEIHTHSQSQQSQTQIQVQTQNHSQTNVSETKTTVSSAAMATVARATATPSQPAPTSWASWVFNLFSLHHTYSRFIAMLIWYINKLYRFVQASETDGHSCISTNSLECRVTEKTSCQSSPLQFESITRLVFYLMTFISFESFIDLSF